MKKVLVLGATGFLGRHVVSQLQQENVLVLAASRHPSKQQESKVQNIALDYGDESALRNVMTDVDCVINCVAGDAQTLVAATQALVNVINPLSSIRVVHISSMAVYGAVTGLISEDTPLAIDAGWYAQAKSETEKMWVDHRAKGGQVVIFRPGCIYGVDSEQWVTRIARLLSAGRIGDLGVLGDGFTNLVHVSDVVQAIIASMNKPDSFSDTFNLAAQPATRWNEYFISLALAIGATPVRRISKRQLMLDAKLLSVGLKVLELILRKLKIKTSKLPEIMPPSLLRLWQQDIRLDASKAEKVLNIKWVTFDDGIKNCADWLKSHHKLIKTA